MFEYIPNIFPWKKKKKNYRPGSGAFKLKMIKDLTWIDKVHNKVGEGMSRSFKFLKRYLIWGIVKPLNKVN